MSRKNIRGTLNTFRVVKSTIESKKIKPEPVVFKAGDIVMLDVEGDLSDEVRKVLKASADDNVAEYLSSDDGVAKIRSLDGETSVEVSEQDIIGVFDNADDFMSVENAVRKENGVSNLKEKVAGAKVIDTHIEGTAGVVLWHKSGDNEEWGTHMYSTENKDAWYWGHYFSEEAAAKADFDKRKKEVTKESRRQIKQKKIEAKTKVGGDSTKVDMEYGKVAQDDPRKLKDPDKVTKPNVMNKIAEPGGNIKDVKLSYYSALIDGMEIERVAAKSKADAVEQLTKSFSISATRREFLRMWIRDGKKVVPANDKTPPGYANKSESRTVEINCDDRLLAGAACKLFAMRPVQEAGIRSPWYKLLDETATITVDVDSTSDSAAINIALGVLDKAGFDTSEVVVPDDVELAYDDEKYPDVGIDLDTTGFEGRIRDIRVIETTGGGLLFDLKHSVDGLSEESDPIDLFNDLVCVSEKLDSLITGLSGLN